jgi:hypothetical protein
MSRRARMYLLGERAARRLGRAHRLWAGWWLPILSRRALHDIDQTMYDRRENYHTAEHNRKGLFPWERAAIDRFFTRGDRIAVIGAGGGREVYALWKDGFRPEGFECHPGLVAVAGWFLPGEGCPHTVTLIPRDCGPPDGEFDAAVIGWSSYCLIPGRQARIALLAGLRPRLPVGGRVLVSFFTREENDRRAEVIHRIATVVSRILRRPPPQPGDDLLPNFVHRFTRSEIGDELAAAGFQVLHWEPAGPGAYDSGWAVAAAS